MTVRAHVSIVFFSETTVLMLERDTLFTVGDQSPNSHEPYVPRARARTDEIRGTQGLLNREHTRGSRLEAVNVCVTLQYFWENFGNAQPPGNAGLNLVRFTVSLR